MTSGEMHADTAGSRGPILGPKARVWLHSINLFLGIGETIVGVFGASMALQYAFDDNTVPFGIASAWVGFLTSLLLIGILAYRNKPAEHHRFTTAKFQCYSLACMGILRIAVGIMFATTVSTNCNYIDDSDGLAYTWCPWSITEAVMGFVFGALLIISAGLLLLTASTGAKRTEDVIEMDKVSKSSDSPQEETYTKATPVFSHKAKV